jgi:hypothetical protein
MKQVLSLILMFFLLSNCKDKPTDYVSISGQWRCQEISNENNSYIIDIEKSSSSENTYAIYNFNQEGNEQKVFATLQNDTLFIETQFIGSSSKSVEGSSAVSIDKKTMQIDYFLTESFGTREITCNCTHL